MKAFLMYRDRDFDSQQNLPSNEEALMQDLELETLFNAMALGDTFLFEVAKKLIQVIQICVHLKYGWVRYL